MVLVAVAAAVVVVVVVVVVCFNTVCHVLPVSITFCSVMCADYLHFVY